MFLGLDVVSSGGLRDGFTDIGAPPSMEFDHAVEFVVKLSGSTSSRIFVNSGYDIFLELFGDQLEPGTVCILSIYLIYLFIYLTYLSTFLFSFAYILVSIHSI